MSSGAQSAESDMQAARAAMRKPQASGAQSAESRPAEMTMPTIATVLPKRSSGANTYGSTLSTTAGVSGAKKSIFGSIGGIAARNSGAQKEMYGLPANSTVAQVRAEGNVRAAQEKINQVQLTIENKTTEINEYRRVIDDIQRDLNNANINLTDKNQKNQAASMLAATTVMIPSGPPISTGFGLQITPPPIPDTVRNNQNREAALVAMNELATAQERRDNIDRQLTYQQSNLSNAITQLNTLNTALTAAQAEFSVAQAAKLAADADKASSDRITADQLAAEAGAARAAASRPRTVSGATAKAIDDAKDAVDRAVALTAAAAQSQATYAATAAARAAADSNAAAASISQAADAARAASITAASAASTASAISTNVKATNAAMKTINGSGSSGKITITNLKKSAAVVAANINAKKLKQNLEKMLNNIQQMGGAKKLTRKKRNSGRKTRRR